MIKIEFWLKKSDTDQGNLEHITISEPKINNTVKMGGFFYVCEVYLSSSKTKNYPIYGNNPVDSLLLASEFIKTHLQVLIGRGYTVGKVENKEHWKLEKLSDNFLQEKIDKIKNDKNISQEEKKKILGILKETFSKTVIGDQLNKVIDEK